MSDRPKTISFEDFLALDLRVGRITEVAWNPKARVPAFILSIDFGELGQRRSSAQLTEGYRPEDLIGRQIIAVTNLPPKRVAGLKSEVLVLAALCPLRGTRLLSPDQSVPPGSKVLGLGDSMFDSPKAS